MKLLILTLLNSKFSNIAVYIKGGNVNVIVLGQDFGKNKSFRCKFRMCCSHFKEKVTLLKFVHYMPCVFAKSDESYYLR